MHGINLVHPNAQLFTDCNSLSKDILAFSPAARSASSRARYRVTSYTWPCVSGTLLTVTCPVYLCAVTYTGQVTFYKVPKTHGHVYLVMLYVPRAGYTALALLRG